MRLCLPLDFNDNRETITEHDLSSISTPLSLFLRGRLTKGFQQLQLFSIPLFPTKMMRTSATRALLRPFSCTKASAAAPGFRYTHANALKHAGFPKRTESLALSAYRPISTSLVRSYASASLSRNVEREKELQQQKLGADPELVSSSSSTHALNSELGAEDKEEDVDMMAGIRHDMVSAEQ